MFPAAAIPFLVLHTSLSNFANAAVPDICKTKDTPPFSERDILQYIFANYSEKVRPRRNALDAVDVTISLRLYAINDLVERENTLILDGYVKLKWTDDYLKWNDTFPFNCLDEFTVPAEYLWLPDVALINSPNGFFSVTRAPNFLANVKSSGKIEFASGGQIHSNCEIDVQYFPFDRQICELHFESWSNGNAAQTLQLSNQWPFQVVNNAWTENRQWLVERNTSGIKRVKYFDEVYYSRAVFQLTLRRKSLFYYINVIVPSLIISAVEIATFALPLGEVIKIHISFTCLLAYSVFQGMVITDLPRSGDSVPLLTLYIDLQMAYIAIIALLGESIVFVVIGHAEKQKHGPGKFLISAFTVIGLILLIDFGYPIKKSKSSKSAYVLEPDAGQGLPSVVTNIKEDNAEKQWTYIARVVSRLNLILYVSAIVATPVVMFSFIPN